MLQLKAVSLRYPFIDFTSVACAALHHSERLVPQWLPDGQQCGNEWIARNPKRNDRRLGSFKINLKSGRWADFATGDAGGDLISLYAYLHGLGQTKAAIRVAREIGYG